MKKLSIEEKTRKYDEAIERGKQIQNTPYTAHWDIMKDTVEHLLPELKESKDERIRKHLIGVVELYYGNTDEQEKKDCLAWLEKQSKNGTNDIRTTGYWNVQNIEQKPAWSEKDTEMYYAVIADIKFTQKAHNNEVNKVVYKRELDWLKSIKDRIKEE